MNIEYFSNTKAMSQQAATYVLEEVRLNPELLLCTATGNSPENLYRILAEKSQDHRGLFEKTRIIPLDEWIGLPTAEGSCHSYISEHVLKPLRISKERYFGFNVNTTPLEKECTRIQQLLRKNGPIDVCILGLGKNGHLGFNEPAHILQPYCHIANLTPQSQEHNMIMGIPTKPVKGLTLGMQDILASKKIFLLISGNGKRAAVKQLLSGVATNDCPATWLWKHSNVYCLIVN